MIAGGLGQVGVLLRGVKNQLGALGLVLNCVTLWNTAYLDRALTDLRGQGYRPVLAAYGALALVVAVVHRGAVR